MHEPNSQVAFVDRMNSQNLTGGDLERLLASAEEDLGTAVRDDDARAILFALHSAALRTLGPACSFDRAMAAQLRVHYALRILAESRGLSFVVGDRFILVRRECLEIAATLPLVENGDDVTFDKKEFLDAALLLIEPEGTA